MSIELGRRRSSFRQTRACDAESLTCELASIQYKRVHRRRRVDIAPQQFIERWTWRGDYRVFLQRAMLHVEAAARYASPPPLSLH